MGRLEASVANRAEHTELESVAGLLGLGAFFAGSFAVGELVANGQAIHPVLAMVAVAAIVAIRSVRSA